MQAVIGLISGIAGIVGFLAIIVSAIAMRFWLITIVVMTIFKLTGIVVMAWFAGPLTAGAISTGLWILILALLFTIIMIISFIVALIGKEAMLNN